MTPDGLTGPYFFNVIRQRGNVAPTLAQKQHVSKTDVIQIDYDYTLLGAR